MIYVMSDIHGNSRRFNSIMKQIKLKPEDTLYILGDVIDRYPDGIRILRKLMAMKNVKMLLGNHEYMMLRSLTNEPEHETEEWYDWYDKRRVWYFNGGDVTHKCFKYMRKDLRAEIISFLESLPLCFDIEVNGKLYKLVHAAPEEMYATDHKYSDSREFAVWKRLKRFDNLPGDYTLIFGHTPTEEYEITRPMRIFHTDRAIGIDCGAGTAEKPGWYTYFVYGRLACLRLDDMKEFYSEEDPEFYERKDETA